MRFSSLHWTCACGVSSGLLSGSVSSDLLSGAAACGPVLLSGDALQRSIATIASPIASITFGARDTSNACLEDAGADNKAALCVMRRFHEYPHVPKTIRRCIVVLLWMSSTDSDASAPSQAQATPLIKLATLHALRSSAGLA